MFCLEVLGEVRCVRLSMVNLKIAVKEHNSVLLTDEQLKISD